MIKNLKTLIIEKDDDGFHPDFFKEVADHDIVIVQSGKKSIIVKNRYGYTTGSF